MFDLKKIMKETANWDLIKLENTQRVRMDLVMEQVPDDIQKEIEKEFITFFNKVERLVPDTPRPQGAKSISYL
ncbi:hypothetical protein QA584_17480 [Anaerocolumna sp. AGMB13025]|uniref:hypothetical protein n=1 Tax=Anaerocolumna sp. AGMB13025 TaxID=3039116 RepID=UPI00241C04D8|nr:hypothetical protein [Anaerocolumna sp. AGMB13025]WFR55393.1 hypothetical protein QA584_17480 [Anaerocolumna sp. AGMB13025]